MNNTENKTSNVFIISKDFIELEEDSSLHIEKLFFKDRYNPLSFIWQNDNLFLIVNEQVFGSVFLGNLVILAPKFLLLVKIDPLLLLLGVIASFSPIEANGTFINIEMILDSYKTQIVSNNLRENSVNFVTKLFYDNKDKLNIICETQESEENFYFKYEQSKCWKFLNLKINLTKEEEEQLEGSEFEEKKKRKLREKCDIILPFIPNKIADEFRKYKGVPSQTKINEISNVEGKRKNISSTTNSQLPEGSNNKQKKKQSTPKKKTISISTISTNQIKLDGFYTKKNK